jgi:predicted NBD/HSP70 family sugar kinase
VKAEGRRTEIAVRLGRESERTLAMPVFVDNDPTAATAATAAAVGERWTGVAADVSDFVYLYLGSGVEAGIFTKHQVCRGAEIVGR